MNRSVEPFPTHSLGSSSSKGRVYSGNSSHRLTDPNVIEVPPLPTTTHNLNPPNFMKQKEAILHDVIDIDKDDDSEDLVVVGEVGKKDKGKTIESIHDAYDGHQIMEMRDMFCPAVLDKCGSGNRVESSNGYTSASHNLINVDDHGSDHSCGDDDDDADYSDLFYDDYLDVDHYALLQALFDSEGIPPGIEAPIPCLADFDLGSKNTKHGSLYPWSYTQSDAKISHVTDSSQPSSSLDPTNPGIQGPSAANHGFVDHMAAKKLQDAGKAAPHWGHFGNANIAAGSSSSDHSDLIGPVDEPLQFPGTENINDWSLKNTTHFQPFPSYTANSSLFDPFDPFHAPPELFDNSWVHNSGIHGNNGTPADSTVVTVSDEARDEILRKFQDFKQFDTIEDTSDHYFVHANSSMKQHSKNWTKRIQEEWKLLEKCLPDSIFVRVYESRIDILRAVIIGAEGTPYHDGLFFFDVFFPSGYPNVPPQVHYHSGGLRLNPNLYNCGKVCLSLLNTWSGSKNEKWIPGFSTILQVLVSIQGLILNAKPYFNEPGYEHLSGSPNGEMGSQQYNEEKFILSLKTMVYIIRRPPKNFEDFVAGHFVSRAHDILVACKAYMDGAQVGCLVKGGVQDVDQGDKSCSKKFKNCLAGYVDMLVKEFIQIGAKDCEKFFSPSTSGKQPVGKSPVAASTS